MLKDVGMTVLKSRKTSAARQGMRACNNTNMRNPIIKHVGGLRMLLLLHALIPCLAAYILPSSPVLLHLFSYFLALSSLHPTFNGNVFTPLFHCFFVVDLLTNTMLFACVRAPPILLLVAV